MNVLIVYAHQEPQSFNGAMLDMAVSTLLADGHEVIVSDLYAMDFKAVADKSDFLTQANPDYFKYGAEQRNAYAQGALAPDILAEQQKVLWADMVIFQFPLWWFTMPAMMKGWVDRVFSYGFTFGSGRWYNHGPLSGKKAMLALTTGQGETSFSEAGINGDLNSLLYHIHHGMLYFVGFEVLAPFIAWNPAKVSAEERERYLLDLAERLHLLNSSPVLGFPPLDDYDENLRLKPDRVGSGEGGSSTTAQGAASWHHSASQGVTK